MKYYISQQIDVVIDCTVLGLDFADAVSAVINYTKPDGSTAQWTPAVINTIAKTLSYSITAGQNDQAGTWILQPVVTFPGSVAIPGTTIELVINARYA